MTRRPGRSSTRALLALPAVMFVVWLLSYAARGGVYHPLTDRYGLLQIDEGGILLSERRSLVHYGPALAESYQRVSRAGWDDQYAVVSASEGWWLIDRETSDVDGPFAELPEPHATVPLMEATDAFEALAADQ